MSALLRTRGVMAYAAANGRSSKPSSIKYFPIALFSAKDLGWCAFNLKSAAVWLMPFIKSTGFVYKLALVYINSPKSLYPCNSAKPLKDFNSSLSNPNFWAFVIASASPRTFLKPVGNKNSLSFNKLLPFKDSTLLW